MKANSTSGTEMNTPHSSLPPLVANEKEVLDNIIQFNADLGSHQGAHLITILSNFISWYAVKGPDGSILLAPSKFVGYSNMTAGLYKNVYLYTTGRDTELHLARWFDRPSAAEEQRLLGVLTQFLAGFGKAINKRARISTLGGHTLTPGFELEDKKPGVIDAMVLLYSTLSNAEKQDFRRRLET